MSEPVSSRRLTAERLAEIARLPFAEFPIVQDLLHDLRVVEEAARAVVDERDNPFLGHAIDALSAALSEAEEPR